MTRLIKIILAIALPLFIICASVIITVAFKPLYYADIDLYDMVEYTGMSRQEICENYDAMVDFLLRFSGDELTLPTLPMSEGGKIHFSDVKHLFNRVKALGGLSFVLAVSCLILLKGKDKRSSLYASGVITIGIPAFLGIFVAVAWDRFFVLFHRIFFDNDYWIFDAQTDPVIRILPDGFFMHCMIMIVLFIALGALVCIVAGRMHGRSKKTEKKQ